MMNRIRQIELPPKENPDENNKSVAVWMTDTNDNSDYQLRRLLRPILLFLMFTGCIGYDDVTLSGSRSNSCSTVFRVASVIYRVIIFLSVIVSLCRMVPVFILGDSSFFTYSIINVVWMSQNVVNACLCFKMTRRNFGQFQEVLAFWDERIIPGMMQTGMKLNVSMLKIKMRICIGMAVFTIMFNTTGVVLLATGWFSSSRADFYAIPFTQNNAMLVFHVFTNIFHSFIWLGPVVLMITISILTKNAFAAYMAALVKATKDNTCKVPGKFLTFRRLHLDLCKFVEDIDSDLSYFYALLFAVGVFISCFCLYSILEGVLDVITVVLTAFWLVCIVLLLNIVFGFAAYAHESAHSPLSIIYYIDVTGIQLEDSTQLNLFLSKLTGTQVGFSTLGLLIITKEFLLTILGVILTYFFLLYTL